MSDLPNLPRMIELERADAAKQALEQFANYLLMKPGAEQYRRAYQIAADEARKFKVSWT